MTWGNPPPFKPIKPKMPKRLTPYDIATGSESGEQRALFSWAALNFKTYPQLQLMFHIPNGGYRNIREAARLKAEGVKAGVPDLALMYPAGRYHGMFIELKKAGGIVSEVQKEWLTRLTEAGYYCVVCYSWEIAKDEIVAYLEGLL